MFVLNIHHYKNTIHLSSKFKTKNAFSTIYFLNFPIFRFLGESGIVKVNEQKQKSRTK